MLSARFILWCACFLFCTGFAAAQESAKAARSCHVYKVINYDDKKPDSSLHEKLVFSAPSKLLREVGYYNGKSAFLNKEYTYGKNGLTREVAKYKNGLEDRKDYAYTADGRLSEVKLFENSKPKELRVYEYAGKMEKPVRKHTYFYREGKAILESSEITNYDAFGRIISYLIINSEGDTSFKSWHQYEPRTVRVIEYDNYYGDWRKDSIVALFNADSLMTSLVVYNKGLAVRTVSYLYDEKKRLLKEEVSGKHRGVETEENVYNEAGKVIRHIKVNNGDHKEVTHYDPSGEWIMTRELWRGGRLNIKFYYHYF